MTNSRTREYKLQIYSGNGTDYSSNSKVNKKINCVSTEKLRTLEECCEKLVTLFEKLNVSDSLFNLKIVKTRLFKNEYFKTVEIINEVPFMKATIKKLSAGNISVDSVIENIKKQKELYERTHNKSRD